MRLLIVNPNISHDVTALIRAEAERVAAPGTKLVVATATYGFEYIETRFESVVAAAATAEVIAEHAGTVDGVVVAAFGDPGLPGLKELAPVPVVGISEAALCVAALQGQRFSIIAISKRISGWYRDCVERFGFAGRLASIRSLGSPLTNIASVQRDHRAQLVDLCRDAVHTDGADILILAGAPLAGLAREVADDIDVPIVDGVSAGVRLAEALAAQAGANAVQPRAGTSARPPLKRRQGLTPALDSALSALQKGTDG